MIEYIGGTIYFIVEAVQLLIDPNPLHFYRAHYSLQQWMVSTLQNRTMTGVTLLCLSLTAGAMENVALVTPGWFVLEFVQDGKESTVATSIFYTEVCLGSVCDTMDNTKAFQKHESIRFVTDRNILGFVKFMIEASLSIVGVGIGTILIAVHHAALVMERERSNSSVSSGLRYLPTAGIYCVVIGVICGIILSIDVIAANVLVEKAMWELDTLTESNITKLFPYSIVIMAIGLVLEIITVVKTGTSTRSKARGDDGIVLTPTGNATPGVVQDISSVSYQVFT